MSDDCIYSINNIIHINNDNKNSNHIVITNDKNALYKNLNDVSIYEQVRIIGGTWFDNIVVRNILAHNDNYGLGNSQLNIGNLVTDELYLTSSNMHLESSKIFDINYNKDTRFILDSINNSIDIGSIELNNFNIEGCNIHIGKNSKVILDGTVYLKQNIINKILYSNGELIYSNTNIESVCKTGFYLSWNIENIQKLIYPACYTFRVTCKFYATNNGGDNIYSNFTIMVNPEMNENLNYPGQITLTEKYENYNKNCSIEDIEIIRNKDNKVYVSIKWKNKNINNNIAIAYTDMEIFANKKIGDILIEKYGSIEGAGIVNIDS